MSWQRTQTKYKRHIKKVTSYSCRNHGSCSYCLSNRTISTLKNVEKEKELMNFIENDYLQDGALVNWSEPCKNILAT